MEKKPQNTASQDNTFAVYTTLKLLILMRDRMGLEAMLEYIGKYVAIVEGHNPELKAAVSKALQLIDVRKAYTDIAS